MFCCALSYTNSEESFLIKEASVVGLCRGSIQSGVILVYVAYHSTRTTMLIWITEPWSKCGYPHAVGMCVLMRREPSNSSQLILPRLQVAKMNEYEDARKSHMPHCI